MKGLVSWTTEGYESGHGNVTVCKQDGTWLNVVFNCHNVGEGQITLAITTAEQFASARFVYDGKWKKQTYAGVVGQMSWQTGSLQFEGRWDDQDDDTVWSFAIEVDGFEFAADTIDLGHAPDPEMDFLDEILDTLDRRYLTDWFESEVTPVLPGVYRVKPDFSATSYLAYATWDGVAWGGARRHASELDNVFSHGRSAHVARRWLGLKEEGSRRVSLLLSGVRQRDLEGRNPNLLDDLRHHEAELQRARAEAHAVYLRLDAQINGSGNTAEVRHELHDILDKLVGADFDSPGEATFDDTVVRTVEDAHAHLLAAREDNAVRTGYWQTYWETVMAKHPAFAEKLTSKGLVVGYGKDMQARLGKHNSMRPLQGSFGTKRRK